MKSNLIDVEVSELRRSERAVLVTEDGDTENAVWLPLALVELSPIKPGICMLTLPEWLALEKGLI